MTRNFFRTTVVALAIGLALSSSAFGQTAARAKEAARPSGLTAEDVIKLAKAGVSEDIIIQQIRKNGRAFDLSTDQLIALKTANVSDRVVQVMLDPARADAPAPAPAVSKPVASAPATPKHAPVEAALPSEVGVYAKRRGQWVEVAPEIVYWKTGGVLKTIATAGIRRGDVNGHVLGASSHTSFASPLELLIVAPEGVALNEYELLHLRANKDNREFRTVTGGILHAQSGSERDVVPFDGKKLASRTYEVAFPATAGAGEFGILPPGSASGSGKIYSFRVAEAPAEHEDAVPTARQYAKPEVVPVKTVLAPAGVQWVTHNDPMGFVVNSPAGWDVRTDHQQGRINVQGPEGQQAVIWPMFVHQQLDARGAQTVAQQLARRVDPNMAWGAPQISGDTVRVFARGQSNGAALMRWNSSAEGTAVYLYCVIAPASSYQASVETFTGILKSFHIVADPKSNSAPAAAKTAAPIEQVAWVRWSDPREGAFTASVPQGWSVLGGAFRQSATDIRKSVVLVSPDHQIRLAVGDANVGAYTAPNGMYARAGMREGGYTSLGDGSKLQIRRFAPASQFIREYVAGAVARECGQPRIGAENQRQDLATSATQDARKQGAPNPQVTAAGVSFTCTWNGREARGYYAAATILPFPGRSGIWYVEPLYGYLAVAEREQQADEISRHVLNSMGINAQWKQREDQIAGNAVAQDNARAQEVQARARQATYENEQKTSDMIVKGYQARSQVYDEISRKRENAILGTVDVVDPSSGKQYKIDNYSDYHWMNNDGVIAGTKTDTSPGADWRQMITLP